MPLSLSRWRPKRQASDSGPPQEDRSNGWLLASCRGRAGRAWERQRATGGFEPGRRARRPALYTVWYNFVRFNQAVKMPPAMAAGVSKTLWSMDNIVALIDDRQPRSLRGTSSNASTSTPRDAPSGARWRRPGRPPWSWV
jgi:hypothetical protein